LTANVSGVVSSHEKDQEWVAPNPNLTFGELLFEAFRYQSRRSLL
jgi:hypothetical protein